MVTLSQLDVQLGSHLDAQLDARNTSWFRPKAAETTLL